MSVKIISELDVVNRAANWIRYKNGVIIQCIFPGSHGGISLTYYNDDRKRRTIFPDIIAVIDEIAIIAEAKSKYSTADAKKLIEISKIDLVFTQIKEIVVQHAKIQIKKKPIFMLLHADEKVGAIPDLYQLVVNAEIENDARLIYPINEL